jgi:hypothetical protein
MVWWPFSSSSSSTPTTSPSSTPETRKDGVPARENDATNPKAQPAQNLNISGQSPSLSSGSSTTLQRDVSSKGSLSSDKSPKNIQAIEERLKELREPGLVDDGIRLQWMGFQEKWVPVIWKDGVSAYVYWFFIGRVFGY